ncbi:MAG: acylphosphatase [Bdellovibrionales bacterium]|nr:acylphosphatase [Bdellovibrionales bacterium]
MSIRIEFRITGLVQGMGIRPKILRMAKTHGITGRVLNESDAVLIEAQSQNAGDLEKFEQLIGEAGEVVEKKYLSPVVREFNFKIDESHFLIQNLQYLAPTEPFAVNVKRNIRTQRIEGSAFLLFHAPNVGLARVSLLGCPMIGH